jgi:hypothetical protein
MFAQNKIFSDDLRENFTYEINEILLDYERAAKPAPKSDTTSDFFDLCASLISIIGIAFVAILFIGADMRVFLQIPVQFILAAAVLVVITLVLTLVRLFKPVYYMKYEIKEKKS